MSSPEGHQPVMAPVDLSVGELIAVLRASHRLIIVLSLFMGVVSGLTAFLLTPIYRSTALLIPASDDSQASLGGTPGQLIDFAGLAGINVSPKGSSEKAIALLKSRVLIEEFIRRENLLPILFDERWSVEQGGWAVEGEDIPTLGDAYERFDKRIRAVDVDRKTGLVTLSVEWKDRERAAAWANGLVSSVNQYTRERDIKEAERSLEYLNRELSKTSVVGMQQVIYKLIEGEIRKIMLANVRAQYAFHVIDPPVTADADAFVRPQRALIIIVGLLLGLVGGVAMALIRHSFRSADHR